MVVVYGIDDLFSNYYDKSCGGGSDDANAAQVMGLQEGTRAKETERCSNFRTPTNDQNKVDINPNFYYTEDANAECKCVRNKLWEDCNFETDTFSFKGCIDDDGLASVDSNGDAIHTINNSTIDKMKFPGDDCSKARSMEMFPAQQR